MIIIGKELKNLKHLKNQLNQAFQMKDLGELTYFLGIQVTRNRNIRTLYLNQARYIHKALERFKLEECKIINIPIDTNIKLIKNTGESYKIQRYQSIVGNLIYKILGTKLNIIFRVSTVS